jgi:hypothetical protein
VLSGSVSLAVLRTPGRPVYEVFPQSPALLNANPKLSTFSDSI